MFVVDRFLEASAPAEPLSVVDQFPRGQDPVGGWHSAVAHPMQVVRPSWIKSGPASAVDWFLEEPAPAGQWLSMVVKTRKSLLKKFQEQLFRTDLKSPSLAVYLWPPVDTLPYSSLNCTGVPVSRVRKHHQKRTPESWMTGDRLVDFVQMNQTILIARMSVSGTSSLSIAESTLLAWLNRLATFLCHWWTKPLVYRHLYLSSWLGCCPLIHATVHPWSINTNWSHEEFITAGPCDHGHGHDDVIKWKHFPHYWPFVRGIHRTTVSDAQLWCFFWYAPEYIVQQTIVRLVIWDAIVLIMTSS